MGPIHENDGMKIGLLAAEEPDPNPTGRPDPFDRIIPLLREQRETWFRIAEWDYSKRAASSTRARLLKKHGAKGYEFKARSDGNTSVLYGRYVGKAQT